MKYNTPLLRMVFSLANKSEISHSADEGEISHTADRNVSLALHTFKKFRSTLNQYMESNNENY